MRDLDSILKSRDITLPANVRLVKTMVFLVVIYECDSWTIKKAERWRIDAFELWCWRRLLRVPWTARRSNQSILKEISIEYSLEGLMLKLKVQYFGHLMRRTDSNAGKRPWCWERLMAGGEGDNGGWDGWMASPARWMWVWVNSWSLLKLMSIESVMPSNHLILCCPLLLLPSIFLSIRVFSNESVLCIRWPTYWSFSICPSNEFSGLISFRMDWFDLLAVQGTFKSFSSTTVRKHQLFGTQPPLWSNFHIHTQL